MSGRGFCRGADFDYKCPGWDEPGPGQRCTDVTWAVGAGPLPLTNIVYTNGSSIAVNTLISFSTAASVSFSGLALNANVLAPNAMLTMDGGQLDGSRTLRRWKEVSQAERRPPPRSPARSRPAVHHHHHYHHDDG